MTCSSRDYLAWAIALALTGCAGTSAPPAQTALAAPAAEAASSKGEVAYSFVFFGCNRLDKDGIKATGSKSTANEFQLKEDFKHIAKLDPAPNIVFLAGDIVAGMKPGTDKMQKQLQSWIPLATKDNPIDLKKTRLIAFTGNHELLYKANNGKDEYPNPPAYLFWPTIMSPNPAYGNTYDFIGGHNGPGKGGPDKLADDESALTYSFQDGHVLFIVLNTDSQVDAQTIGDVPLNWIDQQLQDAQNNPDLHHIFVMGHKPIVAPPSKSGTSDSDEGGQPGARNILDSEGAALNALLNRPGKDGSPTKVRAYLAAHAHEWFYSPTPPGMAGSVPQVVAGNGGSPPDANWIGNPDPYFGYTLVTITSSGIVQANSYGRKFYDKDGGKKYYKQAEHPTKLRVNPVLYAPGKPPK